MRDVDYEKLSDKETNEGKMNMGFAYFKKLAKEYGIKSVEIKKRNKLSIR